MKKPTPPFTVDDLERHLDRLIRLAMDFEHEDDDIERLETAKNIIILQWEAHAAQFDAWRGQPRRKAKGRKAK